MKVLHILSSNRVSGAENVVRDIIKMFEGDIEMAYASLEGPIKDTLLKDGIKYLPLNKINISEIKKAINVFQPDLIHAHDVRASVISSVSTKDIPIISHLHCKFTDMSKLTPKSLLYLLAIKKFKKVIAVSKSTLDEYYFKNRLYQKCIVLPNVVNIRGIKERLLDDKSSYNYDVIFIGRLVDQKDPLRFIKVIKNVCEFEPELKVGVLGDGELLNEMKDLTRKLNLSDNIDYLGFKENPLKILSDSKLMVMTSKTEGTPIAALEAMTLGIPIVSTLTDGMNDLVDHDNTGYLTNHDKELCEYIVRLLTDEHLSEKLSINSIRKANDLNDIGRYKQLLDNLYNV